MPRKKKKNKTTWFGFGSPPSRKKTRRPRKPTRAQTVASLKKMAAVAAAVCVLAGVAVGFGYMERYVHAVSPVTRPTGHLELISPPPWINKALQDRIVETVGGWEFTLCGGTAVDIAARLQNLPWLYNVRIRTTETTIHVYADYRKPSALIVNGNKKYYLSLVRPGDLMYTPDWPKVVLLDYIKLDLPIVEIKGFSTKGIPLIGGAWDAPEITSSVELLDLLARMDARPQYREKPLLEGLATIDVFNFEGRKKKTDAHVVLYARDGTEIRWGAACGKSHLYLEAAEDEKLATLYTFYTDHNYTIQCVENKICQYVELRLPQREIPRPR